MQQWDKASSAQPLGGLEPPPSQDTARHEEKRQRALQFRGERWLLHRANAPARRRQLLDELSLGQPPAGSGAAENAERA